MYGIYANAIQAVRTLLDFNADVSMRDTDGRNLLHIAAKENKLEILEV